MFKKLLIGLSLFAVLLIGFWFFRPLDLPPSVSLVESNQNTVQVHVVFPLSPTSAGLAHYVEHLAWLPNIGKDARPESRDTNAWTNENAMGYWLSGKPDELQDMLQTMTALFQPIAVDDTFAEQEREILQREFDLAMAENPDGQAVEPLNAYLYEGNAWATSVLGSRADIAALTLADAKAYHAATHRPELAQLLVIGAVSESKLARVLETVEFPTLGGAETAKPAPFQLAAAEEKTFANLFPNAAPRMIWSKVVALPQPVPFETLSAQSTLLGRLLDTNQPGGLAGPLRYDAFIAKSFSLSIDPLNETHVEISLFAEPDRGVSFAALQTAFEETLAASAEGIPPETFLLVQERHRKDAPNWDDPEEMQHVMADYHQQRFSELRPAVDAKTLREAEEAVTLNDLNALLKILTGPGRKAVAFIGKDTITP